MSIRIMTQVWATDLPNAGHKIVLLALADNANDEGTCYPSLATLARKCSMTDRSVRRNLRDLEAMGLVSGQERDGRSTVYTLDLSKAPVNEGAIIRPRRAKGAPATPDNMSPVKAPSNPGQIDRPKKSTPDNMSAPPRTICPPTTDNMSPITIIEPSCEPKEGRNTAAVAPAAPPEVKRKTKPAARKITFDACVEQAKAAGRNIISEDDKIYDWAEDASIPDEWLALAWDEFCNRYRHNPKTYIDWAAVYRNAVRGNWFRLWRSSPTGLVLTTEGETARRVRAAAEKRRASSGPVSAHA